MFAVCPERVKNIPQLKMHFAETESLEQTDAASIKNAPIIIAVSGAGPTLCLSHNIK